MDKKAFLIFVDASGKSGAMQSNKFYNMEIVGNDLVVEYGRVGSTSTKKTYRSGEWNKIYNSKVKKGYTDITEYKEAKVDVATDSGNPDFDSFYKVFSKYTGDIVSKQYLIDTCTPKQIEEAQDILNNILKLKDKTKINTYLIELYKVIPRRMNDVREYLIADLAEVNTIVKREQDAIDSMDSSNIIHTSNPFKGLGIEFKEVPVTKEIRDLIEPTNTSSKKIYKVYQIVDSYRQTKFDSWVDSSKDKHTQLLIHGTRNANVFSILKSGLMIRPTNAAVISGAAYGNGVYHSAHTQKSLGYTGWDSDIIFFLQNVHMGKYYTYSGWYRSGKDKQLTDLSYKGLKKIGYDSLYVKPGDGLLNSEYIVYNEEQTVTNYLLWLR